MTQMRGVELPDRHANLAATHLAMITQAVCVIFGVAQRPLGRLRQTGRAQTIEAKNQQ
jgi:hypothetical protein